MAEQPIDKDGFIKLGAIDSIISEFDKWKSKLMEIDILIDKLGKSTPIIQPPKNTEDLNKLLTKIEQLEGALKKKSETETKLSAIEKERVKLAKQTEQAEAKKVIALNKENKELLELRAETNKLNKEQRESVKTAERQSNAYDKLVDETRAFKNESKKLGAELLQLEKNGKRNSKEYNELSLTYARVTKNAQLGDTQLKKLDNTVGDNFRKVGAYENATRKLSSALGALGIAFGISTVIRSTTDILGEFDEKVADVQKTTGLAAKEARELSLALFDIDTRSSITDLQELASAAGRLGITGRDSILGFVSAADKMFVALGDDLPGTAEEIATNIGKIADQFGLIEKYGYEGGLERVGSVINELAATTKAGAGEILDFTNRLAGVANQADISLTDVAALGTLFDDAGQSIEVASSTLAKLLPELSKDQERFAEIAGLTAEEFGNMLSNSPIEALKAVAQGAQSSEKGLNGLNDTLEAFGVDSARAAGIVGVLASSTERLTEIQNTANSALEENTSIADENATKQATWNAVIEKLEKSWAKLIIKFNEGTGTMGAIKDVLLFVAQNLETIVGWIGRAVIAFSAYRLALIAVNVQQAVADKGLKNIIKGFFSLKKGADDGAKAIGGVGKALKAIGWTALIAVAIELAVAFYDIASGAKDAKRRAQELDDYRASADKSANERISKRNETLEQQINKERQLTDIAKSKATTEKQASDLELAFLNKKQRLLDDNNNSISNDIKSVTERKEGYQDLLSTFEKVRIVNGQIIGGNEKLAESLRKAGFENAEYNDTWKTINVTGNELNELRSKLNAQVEATNIRLGIYNNELSDSNKNLSEANTNLIVDSNNRENNRSKIEAQTKGLKDLNKELKKQEITLKEVDDLIKGGRTQEDLDKERDDSEISDLTKVLERENKVRLTLINDFERNEKLTTDEANDQKIIAEIDHLNRMKKLLELYGRDITDIDLSISNAQLQLSKDTSKKIEEENEDIQKSMLESISSSVTLLRDLYSEEIDFAISKQNELIANSQKTIDNIKAAATAGTSQAKESILAEEKAIEEAQQRIEKANKRKARVELISSGINTFNSAIAGGQTGLQALGTTAASMTALTSLLNSLPSFDVGTERIGVDGKGIDGKGGMLAINHKDERILTADQNKMIGFDTTNKELASVMNYYNKGLLKPISEVNPMIMQSDNSEVLKSINQGFSKINNWNMTIEELFGVISVTVDKAKGGDLYRFNKKFKA